MAEGKKKPGTVSGFNAGGRRDMGDRFAEVERAGNVGGTLRRIAGYFTRERGLVLLMLGVVLFGTICGVWAPILQSNAIDIIAGTRTGVLSRMLILMFVIYLFYSAAQFLQDYISAKLSQHVVKRIREELFGKLIDIPVKYLDQHSHGDVMSRMTNDVENISTTISQSLPSLFSGVLTVIGTVSIMLWYCWQLTLLSVLTVALTILITKLLTGKMREFSRRRQRLLGMLNGSVEEIISGYRTVVAYNHQDASVEEFRETSDELTRGRHPRQQSGRHLRTDHELRRQPELCGHRGLRRLVRSARDDLHRRDLGLYRLRQAVQPPTEPDCPNLRPAPVGYRRGGAGLRRDRRGERGHVRRDPDGGGRRGGAL